MSPRVYSVCGRNTAISETGITAVLPRFILFVSCHARNISDIFLAGAPFQKPNGPLGAYPSDNERRINIWTIDQTNFSCGKDRATADQLEDARLKHFDMVLFWALDRFSREGTLKTLEYLQRLDTFGVAWKSFTEQYLDSTGMFRDAVIAILATIAKQEHVRLSECVVAGLRRAKREGKVLGRKRIIVDSEKIRTLHAAGASVRAIAAEIGVSKSLVANSLSRASENASFISIALKRGLQTGQALSRNQVILGSFGRVLRTCCMIPTRPHLEQR